jgi:hypothetical protein
MKTLLSVALLAVLGFSSTAMAQLTDRCWVDDVLMNQTVMFGRNAWARKCGFITAAKEAYLNNENEYLIFSNGCYSYPNVAVNSTCLIHVPISESAACVPTHELFKLGTCVNGFAPSAQTSDSQHGEAAESPGTGQRVQASSSSETAEDVLSFKLANGRDIEVAAHLLLVDGEGNLVMARTLAPGDELLGSDGQKVSISDIHVSRVQGSVRKAQPASHDKTENSLDVEGILAGTPERDSP